MSVTLNPVSESTVSLRQVAFDLYRDIHKGIRAELFSVTAQAGHVDPADRCGRAALAERVRDVRDVLILHAEHEDTEITPVMQTVLAHLATRVEAEHTALEARLDQLQAMADDAADAVTDEHRFATHRLYLELASFTSAYLAHQDVEERIVMPALEAAVGVDAVIRIHTAIISSIPPAQMATSLAFMLPAMNLEDRFDLLSGIRHGAPPEAFAGVWGLAQSVLAPSDTSALADRLGLPIG